MEKLIRDNIPDIAKREKNPVQYRVLDLIHDRATYIRLLVEKVGEELSEFYAAHEACIALDRTKGVDAQAYADAHKNVMLEAGDVLEVYDVLISVGERVEDLVVFQNAVHGRESFLEQFALGGYNVSHAKIAQRDKRKIKGSFRCGMVGIFPDTKLR